MRKTKILLQNSNSSIKLKCAVCLYLLMMFACFFACSSRTQILNNEGSKKDIPQGMDVKIFRLQNRKQHDKLPNISEQELLSIANKTLSQNFSDANPKKVVLCESVLFWHVLYEELGVEFVVSKDRQSISTVKTLPIPPPKELSKQPLSESQALEIAKEETKLYYKKIEGDMSELDEFRTIACELENSWRIYFVDKNTWNANDWNNLPNSNSPNYLIDKRDGEILFRNFKPK